MKRICAIISLLIVVSCLSSCGEKKTKISFLWWPDPGGGFEEIISDFEKKNPGINVEMIKGPTSTDAREVMYATSYLAGMHTYDMVLMDIIWLPKFAARDWIIPLDEWFTKEEQKKFFPGDIKGSIYKGKIYRVPLQTDAGILYYRKDLLDKAGVKMPGTWKQLVEMAKIIQEKPELYGYVFQAKQYEGLVCNFLEILWSFGGRVFDEEGNLTLTDPEAVKALQFMYDLVNVYGITPPGILTYEEEESRHIFQEGRAVFCRNWPYMLTLAENGDSPVKGKTGIGKLPRKEGMGSHSCLGGWGFGIAKFSPHRAACVKFIKYATSPESQKKLHFKSGIVPARKALFDDKEILQKSPHYKELYQILLSARPRPMTPHWSRISDVLRRYIHKVLLDSLSAREALEKAQKEIKEIVR
ncbi:ABC transporter substrate-binding protein [Candidatus Auribacterota bacterium]